MTARHLLPTATLACLCLLPLAAPAQDAGNYSGEVTTGIGYQSSNSAEFGRYTGNTYRGASALSSFTLNYSDAGTDGEGTGYVRAHGSGIEADSHQFSPDAEASVSVGQQGHWGATAGYDGISGGH